MKVELNLSLSQLNFITKLVRERLQEDEESFDILKKHRREYEDADLMDSDEYSSIKDCISELSNTIYIERDILNIFG